MTPPSSRHSRCLPNERCAVTPFLGECSDGDLAALAIGGNQRAYGELLRRYREPVYRIVRSHTGDAEEAIDVTQESFVAAFLALRRFDSSRPFKYWIYRIALNKCRDWARKRAVRKAFGFALPEAAAQRLVDEAPLADIAVDDARRLARASAAIADLPFAIRQPLILRTIDGLSQAETAEIMGISEKAVETRLYRARARLDEILRD